MSNMSGISLNYNFLTNTATLTGSDKTVEIKPGCTVTISNGLVTLRKYVVTEVSHEGFKGVVDGKSHDEYLSWKSVISLSMLGKALKLGGLNIDIKYGDSEKEDDE